ncbi:phenylalanine--tRNA ligase subunit alpha [Bartonella sp. WD12.1]|uniref:phenylalanine--tRNA ligase subunit alpha n=1 Tax=Bartonella sp. WD12.1 TaxID=1933903 RepID=UPI00099AB4AD|nr:phenylalanine--tRNA ligase subunit alpha [Bartonella sp. WD12.1]OPB30445.1 phenylalanyl-tRNA synthetase, alpha subunit [Bartonella sp. WD12.1]
MNDIERLEQEICSALEAANDEQALEAVRIAALGKKGSISERLKALGKMDADERHKIGPVLNGLKNRILELWAQKHDVLKRHATAVRLSKETIDVTLPVRSSPIERGRIHPISQVIDEIIAIYANMGFSIAQGPDIETDYYNFTALNFPEDHPAREMHDTFFFDVDEAGNRKLLRTHTSPVQIRVMEKKQTPIRIIIPGKTYRMDSDATHSPMFHQVEGLVVDKTSTIAHMMWLHETFCKAFFEVSSVKMRFRPSFFPFTEPSMEVDIQCGRSGSQVRFGEGRDWLEILGCGMVHPHVLKNAGFDPDEYQGFAWGMGIDRMAMLKYGMPDLRAFFETDLRWLNHYGFRCFDVPALFTGLSNV